MAQVKLMRNIRLGVKNLALHKLRSLLTTLGVVFGVGSVVAMLSVGEGASKDALEQIRRLGSNNILLASMKPVEETSSGSMRMLLSVFGLLYEDEQRIRETLPGVRRTVPVKEIRKEGRLSGATMELRLVGTTHDWFELIQRDVIAGRVILKRDLDTFANAVVLTETGARKLLATEHVIGQALRIGSEYYEVIGIVRSESSRGGKFQPPDQDVDAYIPITLARMQYGDTMVQRSSGSFTREQVELHQILVEATAPEKVEALGDSIKQMLERFHKKRDWRMEVPLTLLREAEATKRRFNVVLGSIAGISLLVGGIGIMNIMLASVTERTREIGIRRAIGAKRRQIIVQFLIETVVLSSAGGIIGLGLGVGLAWAITVAWSMPTIVTLWSLTLSVGVSMTIGLVFGIYPAVWAANLDPIVALRHE